MSDQATPPFPPNRLLRPSRPSLAATLAVVTELADDALAALCDAGLRWTLGPTGDWTLFTSAGRRADGRCRMSDPAELWEVLATRGVVPLDWVTTPRFLSREREPCATCGGSGQIARRIRPAMVVDLNDAAGARVPLETDTVVSCARCDGVGQVPITLWHPPTLSACVAFASDAPGVQTAEALVRELPAARLGSAARVVWHAASPSEAERVRARDRKALGAKKLLPALVSLLALGYAVWEFRFDAIQLVAAETDV